MDNKKEIYDALNNIYPTIEFIEFQAKKLDEDVRRYKLYSLKKGNKKELDKISRSMSQNINLLLARWEDCQKYIDSLKEFER